MSQWIVNANRQKNGSDPIVQVTPANAGWNYIGFEVYRLSEGETVKLQGAGKETVVIVIEGTCDIMVDETVFSFVGSRESVFEDKAPEAVYAPPAMTIEVVAKRRSEVAVATAKCDTGMGDARKISSKDIPVEHRGSGVTERHIRHLLDEHHPAEKLLLVEVVTPAGNWSSFPPHKHDEEIPGIEARLEETYYYRITPEHGQAIQQVYDKCGTHEILTPHDGDVVLVPKGYHPVAAIPGFKAYYLNVMAGPGRIWMYTNDEDYAHVTPANGNIMGTIENE